MPIQDNGPKDRGPWGEKQKVYPPEIDAMLRHGRERLKDTFPTGLPPVKGFLGVAE